MLDTSCRPGRLAATALAGSLAAGSLAGALGFAGIAQAAGEPTVKSLSVAKGSTSGGTAVLITGTGFNGVNESSGVTFGSTAAGGTPATNVIVLSDTQIAVKAPAGTNSVSVFVTNANGASADTTTDNFTYIAPITVTVPSNTKLSAAGGTTFNASITGAGVSSSGDITSKKITATVNGAVAKVAYGGSSDTLAITAPAGTPTATGGTVSVSVLSDGVTGTPDASNAKYVAVITKLSVMSGPTAGTNGTSDKPAVTITGVGLKGATGWQFDAVGATCSAGTGTKEDTTVTCTNIPAGTAGPVTVNFTPANGATQGITAGATYTYTDLG
ncbi:IPT/TIG domain-containing protein [Cryptosporangium sp. NPDC048952]|uniref:IPT/TIG domain-containing protein n=1 Tax=Cryptosporangium sp. NPDC048952 TaxID=3363961 RepID=UPI00371016AF